VLRNSETAPVIVAPSTCAAPASDSPSLDLQAFLTRLVVPWFGQKFSTFLRKAIIEPGSARRIAQTHFRLAARGRFHPLKSRYCASKFSHAKGALDFRKPPRTAERDRTNLRHQAILTAPVGRPKAIGGSSMSRRRPDTLPQNSSACLCKSSSSASSSSKSKRRAMAFDICDREGWLHIRAALSAAACQRRLCSSKRLCQAAALVSKRALFSSGLFTAA